MLLRRRKRLRKKFPPSVHAAIIKRQNNRCACGCGETFDDVRGVHFDHIIPLWCDGEDAPGNLQALKPKHHAPKTKREAGARAKMYRLESLEGKRKLTAAERELARLLERQERESA